MVLKPFWEDRKRPRFRKPNGSHVRKTKRGPLVEAIEEAASMIRAKQYFYLRDQAMHPSVLASMQLVFVLQLIAEGNLYRALDIETGEPYVSREHMAGL